MTGDESELLLERDGAILIITLNRPSVRNAVNAALGRAIAAALDELDAAPELRVGIVTGAGGTFCAGMDLKAFLAGEPRGVEDRGFAGLTEAPPVKPLIAAVEGPALAGGCEIALSCDLIVASASATFGLPEVKRGLIAGSGGLLRLPRRLPPQIAMEYALTGETIGAADAHRWGLINRLTGVGSAVSAAKDLAQVIAANAPLSVGFSKELVALASQWPGPEAWARQHALLEVVASSADAREGARAFLERRAPQWRGE